MAGIVHYEYIRAKTRERAVASLEDSFADGDVSEGENPTIVCKRDHRGRVLYWAVVLEAQL